MSGSKIDMTGQRCGRLAVIREAGHNKRGDAIWLCRCGHGPVNSAKPKEVIVSGQALRSGHAKSCGCLRSEKCAENMKKNHWSTRTQEQQTVTRRKLSVLQKARMAAKTSEQRSRGGYASARVTTPQQRQEHSHKIGAANVAKARGMYQPEMLGIGLHFRHHVYKAITKPTCFFCVEGIDTASKKPPRRPS